MNQTGHRSIPVLRGYIRQGTLFNAAATVGLQRLKLRRRTHKRLAPAIRRVEG